MKSLAFAFAALLLLGASTAEARLRSSVGVSGGRMSVSCGACGDLGSVGLQASVGLGLGPLLFDIQTRPTAFAISRHEAAYANPASLLVGMSILGRAELSLGVTGGTVQWARHEAPVGGLHGRIAVHRDVDSGLVLSLDVMPMIGREIFLMPVMFGVGWGHF